MPINRARESSDGSSVRDLIEYSQQHPLKWLVDGIVLEGGVHVLHGTEETFKTILSVQLAGALTDGGDFLGRHVKGGVRCGIVELEMKQVVFGDRLKRSFPNEIPNIEVLPETLRKCVLNAKTSKERVEWIGAWAENGAIEFIVIDSLVKLFPPSSDTNKPEIASDVFNQLQSLATIWVIAHDRKGSRGGKKKNASNDDACGSGRVAQDPDALFHLVRPDARAPQANFHWGKMRAGTKPATVPLYFDRVDYRLYPYHPLLHLLRRGPCLGSYLIEEAKRRYDWEVSHARSYVGSLTTIPGHDGGSLVKERMVGHSKQYRLATQGHTTPLLGVRLLSSCALNTSGINDLSSVSKNSKKGASLVEAATEDFGR